MILPPPSFSSDTDYATPIQDYEMNSLFDTDNVGFKRFGSDAVITKIAFWYPPSTFIDYIDISAKAGITNSETLTHRQFRIKVTCEIHDGTTVSLYDSGKVSCIKGAGITLFTVLNIHNFVKRIGVYLYSRCIDVRQIPYISFGKFLAYGSYDSGVRFRKDSKIYSLAHEPTATNCVVVKRNGSNFKIPLVQIDDPKASPIRIRKGGVTYALKYLLYK